MAIIQILQYPDPRLKRKGIKVEQFDERIKQIIADMFETHYAADNCAALAATQLDIDDAPHITVIDFSTAKDEPLCLVNAEIVERSGETNEPEGCMSVAIAPVYERVKRAEKIRVKALDREGNPLDFEADDFLAKCIQHELDHLDGTIFIDRISKLKRSMVDKKIAKVQRLRDKADSK